MFFSLGEREGNQLMAGTTLTLILFTIRNLCIMHESKGLDETIAEDDGICCVKMFLCLDSREYFNRVARVLEKAEI